MQITIPVQKNKTSIQGNTNSGLLKLFALLFMIIDHTGAVFFSGHMDLRVLGRIAFPLYVWCIVIGIEHTHNHWRYALRLLFAGIISQPFYMWGLNHTITELNVMFTLFFGLLALICIKEKRYYSHIWGPVLILAISCMMRMDYGWRGILLIIALYSVREKKSAIAAVMFIFCLYWGTESMTLQKVFGIPLPNTIRFFPYGSALLRSVRKLQFFAVLALPFMVWPNNKGRYLKIPKWIEYFLYPGHLAVLAILRHYLL